MRKDKEQQDYQVKFEDSDYQIDMRIDPLTTMDTINTEIKNIKHKQNERKQKAETDKQKNHSKDDRTPSEGSERPFAQEDETINPSKNAE